MKSSNLRIISKWAGRLAIAASLFSSVSVGAGQLKLPPANLTMLSPGIKAPHNHLGQVDVCGLAQEEEDHLSDVFGIDHRLAFEAFAEVGPGRMKARGLDEKGLEDYYHSRNLLKAKVTAEHVANAVLFFVLRETPTTGACIPVDGGLPDATPR